MSLFKTYIIIILTPLILLLLPFYVLALKFYPSFKEVFIAKVINLGMPSGFNKVRAELFSSLQHLISSDEKLREQKQIRLVEIGTGSGSNFSYLPERNYKLTIVEKNKNFYETTIEKLKAFKHIELEKFLVQDANEMSEIADESVDAVICTHVLCSCDDVTKVLDEVRRVLVKGGKFYFFEHVPRHDYTFHYIIQWVVNSFWHYLLDCNLVNNSESCIREADFSDVQLKSIIFETEPLLFNYNVYGVSTK